MNKKEQKYKKNQILESKQFNDLEKDILKTLLDESKNYTVKEAKIVIEKFRKKEVA